MKRFPVAFLVACLFTIAGAVVPQSAKAQGVTYSANVGAETKDQGVQADAFLPNELWLLENDSVTWTFVPKNEIHTVTLLTPGQVRPQAPPPAGPPFVVQGVACGPAPVYNGSACVSTPAGFSGGATFTVKFTKAGNYKLVCLVHTDMNGTVHVLVNNAANAALLHSQHYYDQQAADEASDILKDRDHQKEEVNDLPRNGVLAGTGEIVGTGGGTQYRAVVRFLDGTIRIHKGESVEWTNVDPTEPHTVTFGTEPANFIPPVPANLGAPLADGTQTGTITSTSQFLNSGFVVAQIPDRTGSPQLPPGTTRIRITFPNVGTYQYHCALHDVDGMNGTVIVEP
jgi:plastocyanin